MPRVTTHRTIDAPAALVWEVVTDPDVYAEVAPNLSAVEVVDGEGEGMVRRCVDTDGNVWREACHRWEPGRGFAVSVDTETSDFHRRLFTRFEGEWRLSPRAEGVRVTIQFDFETQYGPLGWPLGKYFEYRAPALVESIFDGWEAEVEARRADPDPSSGGTDPPGTGREGPRTGSIADGGKR